VLTKRSSSVKNVERKVKSKRVKEQRDHSNRSISCHFCRVLLRNARFDTW